jgi:hypothetical protein
MVTKELIEYVKSRRSGGSSEGVIKKELVNNNWNIDDVEEALNKINSFDPTTPFEIHKKDRDNVFVIDSTKNHPATVAKNNLSIPVGGESNPIISVISLLLIVISFLLIYKAGLMITVMRIIDSPSYTSGTLYYFLKEFPSYGHVIIFFAVYASMALYSAFTVKTGSRKSFIFSLLCLIILPVVLTSVNHKLILPIIKHFSISPISFGYGVSKLSTEDFSIIGSVFNEPVSVISFITLIILLVSYKKFKVQNNKISKKNILTIVSITLVFIVPSVIAVISGYSVVRNTDFGYKKVSSKANFHVYRPDPMPSGLDYASNFSEERGFEYDKKAIHITCNFSLNKSGDAGQSKSIVLKQMKVNDGFSMEEFISKMSGAYGKLETINLPLAKDNKAYFVDGSLNTQGSKSILILTNENVLISVSTVLSSRNDLINIAYSLK